MANKIEAASNDESDEDNDEMNVGETSLNWRHNLAQKARSAYLERQSNTQNLMKIVYGAINAVNFHFKVFFLINY